MFFINNNITKSFLLKKYYKKKCIRNYFFVDVRTGLPTRQSTTKPDMMRFQTQSSKFTRLISSHFYWLKWGKPKREGRHALPSLICVILLFFGLVFFLRGFFGLTLYNIGINFYNMLFMQDFQNMLTMHIDFNYQFLKIYLDCSKTKIKINKICQNLT